MEKPNKRYITILKEKMKCQSCNAEIPPEWVNAIKSNVCPGCGEAIMQEEVVNLMNELADTISKMEFNAQEITGWLLSNYRLEKVGDGEPSGFHRPKNKSNNVKEANVDYSSDQLKRLNGFYKRSDVSPDLFQKRKKDLLKNNDFVKDDVVEDDVIEDNFEKEQTFSDEDPSSVLSSEEIEEIAKRVRRERSQNLPDMEDYDYSNYGDDSIDLPPNASPQLKAYAQLQLEKNERARENVTSGVRLNKNSFSRSG